MNEINSHTESGESFFAARMLFVDDDTMFLRLLKMSLEKYNDLWEMEFVQDSTLAIDKIKRQKYDVVLSDIKMPKADGFEVFDTVREYSSDTAMILATGMPEVSAAVQAIKAGAAEYLCKPVSMKEIEQAVVNALEQRKCRLAEATCQIIATQGNCMAGYSVVRMLDEGAMGTVYLVEDDVDITATRYALKILKTGRLPTQDHPDAIRRFIREAKTAQLMDHPNVIQLHDFGFIPESSTPYMVMEHFDGSSLKEVETTASMLNYWDKAKIIRQVADALSEVHRHIVCHRDIKPDNILINKKLQVKLIDFGIAKLPGSELTQADCTMGTPAYLSPEAIIDSENIGPRGDLFSLGVLAFELMFHRRPFTGANIATLARQIVRKPVEDPLEIDPNMPPALRDIIVKLLEKKPEDRFATADDVVAALDKYLAGIPVG